jgi:hypothetical protein
LPLHHSAAGTNKHLQSNKRRGKVINSTLKHKVLPKEVKILPQMQLVPTKEIEIVDVGDDSLVCQSAVDQKATKSEQNSELINY